MKLDIRDDQGDPARCRSAESWEKFLFFLEAVHLVGAQVSMRICYRNIGNRPSIIFRLHVLYLEHLSG